MFDTFCDADDPYYPLIIFSPQSKDHPPRNRVVQFSTSLNFYLDFDLRALGESAQTQTNQEMSKLKQLNVKNVGIRLCRKDESHHQLFQRVAVPSFSQHRHKNLKTKQEL